jgi:glutamyl-tRNA reductase
MENDISYQEWAETVYQTELAHAQKSLANGEDINLVLEAMSERIKKKMLHPLYKIIKDSNKSDYDPIKSKEEYYKKLERIGKSADHVSDDY